MTKQKHLYKAETHIAKEVHFFNTLEEGRQWIQSHPGGTLKKRTAIRWAYPLDQIFVQEAWVRVD